MIERCLECRRALDCRGGSPLCESCAGELLDKFELANAGPAHKPATFTSLGGRQRKLLDGMDCLPGQRDLF